MDKLDISNPANQETIKNRYRLLREIGRGGMAVVYLAEDLVEKRQVALKRLKHESIDEPTFRERFGREIAILHACHHPNIVRIYDSGFDDDQIPFYTMEYLSGGSLADLIKQTPRLPLPEFLDYTLQILDCLTYIHRLGFIHRDIKPGSILFDEKGNLRITDFGIVKQIGETLSNEIPNDIQNKYRDALREHSNTRPNVVIGTPIYIAPEQVRRIPLDHRTDLYSLGVMLFELLTGSLPYEAETPYDLCMKHLTAPIPNPQTRDASIPFSLAVIIMKLMAKSANDRYPTAQAVKNHLMTIIMNTELGNIARLARHVACYRLEVASLSVL